MKKSNWNNFKNMVRVALFCLSMVVAVCSLYLLMQEMCKTVVAFIVSVVMLIVFGVANKGVLL